jgi:hypothetical protein
MRKSPKPELPQIEDELGMAERFQRGLQRALISPPHIEEGEQAGKGAAA